MRVWPPLNADAYTPEAAEPCPASIRPYIVWDVEPDPELPIGRLIVGGVGDQGQTCDPHTVVRAEF